MQEITTSTGIIEERREEVRGFAAMCSETVVLDEEAQRRAKQLADVGFKPVDALHVACAKSARCDVLLTTDDRFEKKAKALASTLRIRVANASTWLLEVLRDEHD